MTAIAERILSDHIRSTLTTHATAHVARKARSTPFGER
jgi:hypothetical protein